MIRPAQFILVILFVYLLPQASRAQILTDDHNLAVDLIYEADSLIDSERYAEAIVKLEQSVALDSMIREQYILLTRACFHANQMATAKSYLRKAQLIFQEDDELCYYLGKVYEREMNLEMAINEYDRAIEWSRQNGSDFPIVYDYYASRGSCYLHLEKYQDALNDLDEAFRFNQQKASILMRRGIALYHLNQKDEACNSWARALEMGFKQAEIYLDQNCK